MYLFCVQWIYKHGIVAGLFQRQGKSPSPAATIFKKSRITNIEASGPVVLDCSGKGASPLANVCPAQRARILSIHGSTQFEVVMSRPLDNEYCSFSPTRHSVEHVEPTAAFLYQHYGKFIQRWAPRRLYRRQNFARFTPG
jgi:hypothetical protein